MKKLLLLIMLLPMMGFSQTKLLCYEAVSASSGYYDPLMGTFHWKTEKPASIAVVYDMENFIITIHAKKQINLEILRVEYINDYTWSLETRDDKGVYVVVSESMPDIGDHFIILNYLNCALKFVLQPM